jgi:hypothetical protein
MADEFNENMDEYTIEYKRVLNSKDFTSSTRLLAAGLMENPYKSVGDYLKELSDSDIESLIVKINEDDMEELLLLSEMLARAEGVVTKGIEEITKNTNTMSVYIVSESLHRKGLIELYHEYLSFGDEYGDKIVMKKKL